jgi:hypothetical protein
MVAPLFLVNALTREAGAYFAHHERFFNQFNCLSYITNAKYTELERLEMVPPNTPGSVQKY